MDAPWVLAPQRLSVTPREGSVVAEFSTERGDQLPDVVQLQEHLARALPRGSSIQVEVLFDGLGNAVHHAVVRGGASVAELALRLEQIISCLLIVPAPDGPVPLSVLALDWQTRPKVGSENPPFDPDDPLASIPTSIESETEFERTDAGELEYRAKWRQDDVDAHELGRRLAAVAKAHEGMMGCELVLATPSRKDLSQRLASAVANAIGAKWGSCDKQNPDITQSSAVDGEQSERQRGNIILPKFATSPNGVLVVDDLYRSGNTMMEVTRCLTTLGVSKVYGLVATKSLRHHRQV